LLYRGIEDAHARAPDVRTSTVAFDERDDRIVGHDQLTIAARDGRAIGGRLQMRELWHIPSCKRIATRRATLGHFPGCRDRIHTGDCGKACGKQAARHQESLFYRMRQRFAPSWCDNRVTYARGLPTIPKRQIILERFLARPAPLSSYRIPIASLP